MTNPPPASTRDLARRLLAVEAASQAESLPHVHDATRVCEKLRVSLTRFAGADGFTSLMRRALALARAEVPALHRVQITAEGSVEGLDELAADAREGGEAAAAITTHLLGLLVTFVGERITLKLVHDAWPDASLSE